MLSVWKVRFASIFIFFMYISHVVVFSKENTLQRDPTKRLQYVFFNNNPFHALAGKKIETAHAETGRHCLLRCVKNLQCFSTNIGVEFGQDGKVLCELLSSDKYSSSRSFQPSPRFHHYSIPVSWYFFFRVLMRG